jgi:CRP-like cAMP-binding protein
MTETDALKCEILGRSSLFKGLSDMDYQLISHQATLKQVEANSAIFRKGDTDGALFIVASGQVRISITSEGGREMVLNLIGAGDTLGEIGFIDGKGRTADATATQPSLLLRFDQIAFKSFLKTHSEMLFRLVLSSVSRTRWVSEQLEDQSFLSVRSRLAKRLLLLMDHFSVKISRGYKLTAILPQRELAGHLNIARESLNRLLKDLIDQDIIEQNKGFFIIRNVDALRALANDNDIKKLNGE